MILDRAIAPATPDAPPGRVARFARPGREAAEGRPLRRPRAGRPAPGLGRSAHPGRRRAGRRALEGRAAPAEPDGPRRRARRRGPPGCDRGPRRARRAGLARTPSPHWPARRIRSRTRFEAASALVALDPALAADRAASALAMAGEADPSDLFRALRRPQGRGRRPGLGPGRQVPAGRGRPGRLPRRLALGQAGSEPDRRPRQGQRIGRRPPGVDAGRAGRPDRRRPPQGRPGPGRGGLPAGGLAVPEVPRRRRRRGPGRARAGRASAPAPRSTTCSTRWSSRPRRSRRGITPRSSPPPTAGS